LTSVGGGGAPAPPTLIKPDQQLIQEWSFRPRLRMTETNAYVRVSKATDSVSHPNRRDGPTLVMEVEIRDEAMHPGPE